MTKSKDSSVKKECSVDNDEKQKRVQFPYDGLFRDFFDDKEVAASFMKEYGPGKINRHFDFDT
ncbi:MAG: Rpn family recombination-promoting nuclease/putative transposase, partial [bacterium]|nr:Rpn family recombination-promoting nuclease/putative transposase [bacterium]